MREDSVYVIAEVGSCHDGDLVQAVQLIRGAARADADAVKFQYWSSTDRMVECRRAPAYRAAYEAGRVPASWLPVLAGECARASVDFLCTAYLPEDVKVVAPYVRTFKVSSFEAEDEALLRAHLPWPLPVIVSLGMGGERVAHQVLGATHQLHFLCCVSAYPTTHDALRLSRLWDREIYAGFSDHSPADEAGTGALAVAAGARILERHVRHAGTSERNADFLHSMDLHLFDAYVTRARRAWDATRGEPAEDVEAAMRAHKVVAS